LSLLVAEDIPDQIQRASVERQAHDR
jgi:hypothetical protein